MNDFELLSDQELIAGCKKNDRKMQEALYRKYAKKMFAICKSYADDNDAAKDILQDSFIKVFDNIKEFTPTGSLEYWIRRIITNTAIDFYRKTTRINKFIEEEKKYSTDYLNENIISKLNFEEILLTVRKLPEGARIIFNLFVLEGYSHEEISQKLHISVGTSKSQINRARGILQKQLTEMRYKM